MVYNLQNQLFLSSHTPLEQQMLVSSVSRTCHLHTYSFVFFFMFWPSLYMDHGLSLVLMMVFVSKWRQTCQTLKARFLHSTLSHSSHNLWSLCAEIFALYNNFMGSFMKTLWLFLCVESHALSCHNSIDNSNN